MSNSKSYRPTLFLSVAAALAVIAALSLVILTALVDPTGLVGLAWPQAPRLCVHGIQVEQRHAKPYILALRAPAEVILGNSKVGLGFAEADMRPDALDPVLNLSLAGAQFEEMAALYRIAAAPAALRRIWIGLDFSMFLPAPRQQMRTWASEGETSFGTPQWTALSHGIFNRASVLASLQSLKRGSCTQPPITIDGFEPMPPVRYDDEGFRRSISRFIAEQRWRMERSSAISAAYYSQRMAELTGLLNDAAQRGIEVVLFINPSHPDYLPALAEAGLDQGYAIWRRNIGELATQATRPGFAFLDFTDLGASKVACQGTVRAPCPFIDLIHYNPETGRHIRQQGLEKLKTGQAPVSWMPN